MWYLLLHSSGMHILLVLRLLNIEQFDVIPNKILLCFMLVLGKTPVHYAIQGDGAKDVVKYLIDNGADPNKATRRGTAPLHCAAERGFLCRCIYM